MATTPPFANFANNRREFSLNPPIIHGEFAENEAIFDIIAITFANFANWLIAINLSSAAQTVMSHQIEKVRLLYFPKYQLTE